ncbi:NUDIX hydrolase [Terrabacter sp. GCM10028922]|uniref:NUDIX hydrolase n=1 Tax=Terrabacter sp. GCM10028922 TaxID=3273428 RepID=UPI003624623D
MDPHNMTGTPRHSVSVAAAIFDHGGKNVLLIKRRDNGKWEPPGGVLELDETIEDGLRREVREETGAEIEVGPLTGVYKNMARGIVALVFRCTITSPPVDSTAEAREVKWTALDLVPTLADPAYATRVLDAGEDGTSPTIRAHDGRDLL